MKSKTAVVALMAVFTLGICFIFFGAVSTEIQNVLKIDPQKFGSLVMSLFLTSCVVELIIGPLVDKLGYKPIAVIGFIIVSVSMFVLAFTASFGMALFAFMLLGVGAMSLNTVGNTLIPVVLFDGKDPARASNFGNAFFGLGYVLTPFLFTLFLKTLKLSYSISFTIFGILALVCLFFALTSQYPQVPIGFRFSKALSLLGKAPVLIAALALFCYISLETTMGTWINTFMQELYGKTPGMTAEGIGFWAGMVLTLYGIAMMLGRFISSTVKNLTAIGVKVIAAMAVLSLIAIVLMILAKSPIVAIVAVLLVGLAFAPIFPTIVGVTFAKFEPSLYGSIFGIIFAIGLLGGTFVPKLIGDLSKGSSIQQSLTIAAIMAAILLILSLVMSLTGNAKKQS